MTHPNEDVEAAYAIWPKSEITAHADYRYGFIYGAKHGREHERKILPERLLKAEKDSDEYIKMNSDGCDLLAKEISLSNRYREALEKLRDGPGNKLYGIWMEIYVGSRIR